MSEIVKRNFSSAEWNEVVSEFDDLSLGQTWEYAEAKAGEGSWKIERALIMEGDRAIGAVQAMVRPVPWFRNGLVWISRGPLWRRTDHADPSVALNMLEALRRYWVVERAMYLRILPTLFHEEVDQGALADIGYRLAKKSVVWTSAVVDLSKTREELRSRLNQKWRNCLNKAERQGMVVESNDSQPLFEELLAEYRQMLRNKGFASVVTPDLLSQLQANLPADRKLWALVARLGDQSLGGVLIARYGKTCEYLVGAVNDAGKAINAGQFLLWQAVCQMKDMGYDWLDVGGTDPLRTPKGILHFKKGLGGVPYELGREIEAFNLGLITRAIRWRVSRARQIS